MSSGTTGLPGSKADSRVLEALSRRKFVAGVAGAAAGLAGMSRLGGADASGLKQFGLANYLAQSLPEDAAAALAATLAAEESARTGNVIRIG